MVNWSRMLEAAHCYVLHVWYVSTSRRNISVLLLIGDFQGPTVFPITFAAVVGRSLKSVAATLLERGSKIGSIECLLGGRTVASAVILPFSMGYLHPFMLPLIVLWSLSPLGGQAALRVISVEPSGAESSMSFDYIDLSNSPFLMYGLQFSWELEPAVLSDFSTALNSPPIVKSSSQDLFGNIKIPMLEALATDQTPDGDGWYDIQTQSPGDVYSSLTGLPFSKPSLDTTDRAFFDIETSYISANCNLSLQKSNGQFIRDAVHDTQEATSDVMVLTNNRYLAFVLDSNHDIIRDGPLRVKMWSEAFIDYPEDFQTTIAVCVLRTTYVETQVYGEGTTWNVSKVRESKRQHADSNLTGLEGIFNDEFSSKNGKLLRESFLGLLVNATVTRADLQISPLEYFIANPDSPFSGSTREGNPVLYSVGDSKFSLRFSQLMNTLWLDGVAPHAIASGFSTTNDTAYRVATVEGTILRTKRVVRCELTWLVALSVSSLIMLSSGLAALCLDICRIGPDVLDTFTTILKDNRYASAFFGSSVDDSVLTARRLREAKVQLGDVHPEDEFGHIAIFMPHSETPGVKLKKKRLYI
jgi:hypothetical protein